MELKKALQPTKAGDLRAQGVSDRKIKGFFKAKGKALKKLKKKQKEFMDQGVSDG